MFWAVEMINFFKEYEFFWVRKLTSCFWVKNWELRIILFALDQIKDKQYATELRDLGIQRIWGIGIVVDKKQVWVESLKC